MTWNSVPSGPPVTRETPSEYGPRTGVPAEVVIDGDEVTAASTATEGLSWLQQRRRVDLELAAQGVARARKTLAEDAEDEGAAVLPVAIPYDDEVSVRPGGDGGKPLDVDGVRIDQELASCG